ncbi:MAG: cytochrome c biogenesis protein ResB, partial [Acidobacteriota bacterium]
LDKSMSTIEQELVSPPLAAPARRSAMSPISALLRLFSSVRLGVAMLCMLGLACFLGMIIMQQNVDGFENYFAALTPAQRLVYSSLGLFNIYHAWYFNLLLGVLSLNIVLASIDRFPKTWRFISRPPVAVPLRWLDRSKYAARIELPAPVETATEKLRTLLKRHGWTAVKTASKDGRVFLFAERGRWNRLGAYPVHVALLTIFLGGFLTSELGTTGNLPLAPGETSDLIRENVVDLNRVSEVTKKLPFKVTFTDIEQKLIRKEGSLGAGNTIDWITRFTISDDNGSHDAMVQMNRPYDYRGYRFFQASYVPTGRARNITLSLQPAGGGSPENLTIERDGTKTLADGTRIRFAEFRGSFRMGPEDPNEDTSDYPNPAAVLQVTPAGGMMQTAYAFGPQMANIPIAGKPIAGYLYQLVDFEKVSDRHILSVQRDPGSNVVYIGFSLLFLTLVAVFFFSHQRVWVVLENTENGGTSSTVGGDTNRSENAFVERLEKFKMALAAEGTVTEVK